MPNNNDDNKPFAIAFEKKIKTYEDFVNDLISKNPNAAIISKANDDILEDNE